MKSDKITRVRCYEDACAAAHALDLVGDRWALLVMRELMLGPRRFADLRAGLPGISANVLTQRLGELEASGIVRRRKLPRPAPAQVYELTAWGRESEPIFQALGRWAARSPHHDPTLPFSAASLMLSLRTMFDPVAADGVEVRLSFELEGELYAVCIGSGRIEVRRGATEPADVVLSGTPRTVAGLIYGGADLQALEAAALLTVEGDRALLPRLPGLFPLPPKAGA